ncbi:MAG TPA: hypothetical protein VFN92_08170 [Solirubrobacterales bacterium]|nr:hypothetical protein [Solirubrobacterales bacterium]
MTVVDEKGLRLARGIRKAITARDEDPDLKAAVEAYDQAVTPDERQEAAANLLVHSTNADNRYRHSVVLTFMQCLAPELLPEDER